MHIVGAPYVRFLGRKDFRPLPIAVLTERGTIRSRKTPGQWGQQYQPGGPREWLDDGFTTVGLHCTAGRCGHYAKVALTDLPQNRSWAEIGPRLLCQACGEIGAVSIEVHWHTRRADAPVLYVFRKETPD